MSKAARHGRKPPPPSGQGKPRPAASKSGKRSAADAGLWLGRGSRLSLGFLAVLGFGLGFVAAAPNLLPHEAKAFFHVEVRRSEAARPARALLPVRTVRQSQRGALAQTEPPSPPQPSGAAGHRKGGSAPRASDTSAEPGVRSTAPTPSHRVASYGHYRGRAALVIDDCGNSWKAAEGFVHAPVPLTLAVLPHLPFSTYIANEAHAVGKGVMLHFPMEAVGGKDPGPGTLRIGMSESERGRLITKNLEAVPHLDGVNNHEGSKVTADETLMLEVLSAVKQRNLFFVDSLTSPHSCGTLVAGRVGLRFSRRDVFIDNVDEIEPIKSQLRELMESSLDRGEAIGIGHVRQATLTAILEMLPAFEESGVKLILARELKPLRLPAQGGHACVEVAYHGA